MTLCQTVFRLQTLPLCERQLKSMELLKGQLFGMRGFQIKDEAGQLVVNYDASRLSVADVEAALKQAGIPVCRN